MLFPDEDRFLKDSGKYSYIPVCYKMDADFDTPLSLFCKLGAEFLLESVENGNNVGRYSIIAKGKKIKMILKGQLLELFEYTGGEEKLLGRQERENPLLAVRDFLENRSCAEYKDLPPFYAGALGYLGYETISYFEKIPEGKDSLKLPDGILIIPELVAVYDNISRQLYLIYLAEAGRENKHYRLAMDKLQDFANLIKNPYQHEDQKVLGNIPDKIKEHYPANEYKESVKKAKQYIHEGEIIQVVLSRRFSMSTPASAFELYRSLRRLNPSPYLFYLDFDDFQIIGSSPEVMVRVKNDEVLLKPIAGTRPRGKDLEEDLSLEKELLADQKEISEHLMLVDLGRNDLGRISQQKSVIVSDYMSIERYSHVMHIVSTVCCHLDPKKDAFDVIKAVFPAGTLSGAPKIRAMEIIHELEEEKRGPYGGMVLNLGFNGNLDSCITIRSMVLKDGTAYIQAGAGIVADSDPQKEEEECRNKAGALIQAVAETNRRISQ